MEFALATPTHALLLPSQCFPQARDRLRNELTGHRRPCARDAARHCQLWCQYFSGTLASNLASNLQQSNIMLAEANGYHAGGAERMLLERFSTHARKLAFTVGRTDAAKRRAGDGSRPEDCFALALDAMKMEAPLLKVAPNYHLNAMTAFW